jgi:hypothetical protein
VRKGGRFFAGCTHAIDATRPPRASAMPVPSTHNCVVRAGCWRHDKRSVYAEFAAIPRTVAARSACVRFGEHGSAAAEHSHERFSNGAKRTPSRSVPCR